MYTARELDEAEGWSDPIQYYATRFAGKEAVFKCFSEFVPGCTLRDIEILTLQNGQPTVTLSSPLQAYAERIGVTSIQISLSYETDYAIAYALMLMSS